MAFAAPGDRRRRSYRRRNMPLFRRRRRRNPALALPVRELVPVAAWGIAGGIATRAVPQMLLREQNAGWMGYLANAVTAGVLSWGASQWISRNAGVGVLIGGAVMTFGRIVEETLGKRVVEFSPGFMGAYDDRAYDLGLYVDNYFSAPTVSTQPFQRALPPGVAVVPANGGNGENAMAGLGRYNRFAS